jgi:hypothetical protein
MATTTPNYGWPVPTSTDYVKDGATAIEALGDAIDATVFALPTGGLTKISNTTLTASSGQAFTGLTPGSRYKILLEAYSNTNGAILCFQFREGSTNKTTNYFGGSAKAGYNASTGSYYAMDASGQANIMQLESTSVNYKSRTSFDLFIEASGDSAAITGTGLASYNSLGFFFGFENRNMSACDGFYIFPFSGNMTGSLTLYKYQD